LSVGRALVLLLAAAAVLAGCGSAKQASPRAETSQCKVITRAALDDARLLLHDESGVDPSPADLPFYDLRVDLANAQARCRPAWVGDDFGTLSAARRTALYDLLPGTYVDYLKLALACSVSENSRSACTAGVHTIHSPGATGTGKTPHPVVPS
jgi:hypothetical protein